MDANEAYCNYCFTIYVSQSVMLYTFDLHNEIYQFYLSKTGGKAICMTVGSNF